MRIGINALYLIPGGVGGTEIYLRALLPALAKIDPVNRYFVFTNRETGAGLVPVAARFPVHAPQAVFAGVAARAHSLGADPFASGRVAYASGRDVQSGLHGFDSCALVLR